MLIQNDITKQTNRLSDERASLNIIRYLASLRTFTEGTIFEITNYVHKINHKTIFTSSNEARPDETIQPQMGRLRFMTFSKFSETNAVRFWFSNLMSELNLQERIYVIDENKQDFLLWCFLAWE